MNAVTPMDRYANAPSYPFVLGHQWFARARAVWRAHFFFLLLATLAVLVARWQLDFLDGAAIIVLSYLTDAILFTWVIVGVQASDAAGGGSGLRAGWRGLHGRWKAVALSSLWGVPAAMASFLLFWGGPEIIKALVAVLGVNVVGVAALLALVLTGTFITFLLCMVPVLAAAHVARDAQAGFKVGGLWAFRGVRAGWKPLLVVFMVFFVACCVAGALLTYIFGHLPPERTLFGGAASDALGYWYPWPGLFVAMNAFIALLAPVVQDLLSAADVDLSDEIASDLQKAREGDRFVGFVLERAGFAVRVAAAGCVLVGLAYTLATRDSNQFLGWLLIALVLYLAGSGLYRVARRANAAADSIQSTALANGPSIASQTGAGFLTAGIIVSTLFLPFWMFFTWRFILIMVNPPEVVTLLVIFGPIVVPIWLYRKRKQLLSS